MIYPDLDGSLGRAWGAAAIAWGLAFVTVAHATAAKRAGSTTGSGEESESSKA